MAKCYFAKHKLVWEVLDGGLKNKIEIQWSDIVAIKATYPDDEPGTLDVVVILLVFCLFNIFVFAYRDMHIEFAYRDMHKPSCFFGFFYCKLK